MYVDTDIDIDIGGLVTFCCDLTVADAAVATSREMPASSPDSGSTSIRSITVTAI